MIRHSRHIHCIIIFLPGIISIFLRSQQVVLINLGDDDFYFCHIRDPYFDIFFSLSGKINALAVSGN